MKKLIAIALFAVLFTANAFAQLTLPNQTKSSQGAFDVEVWCDWNFGIGDDYQASIADIVLGDIYANGQWNSLSSVDSEIDFILKGNKIMPSGETSGNKEAGTVGGGWAKYDIKIETPDIASDPAFTGTKTGTKFFEDDTDHDTYIAVSLTTDAVSTGSTTLYEEHNETSTGADYYTCNGIVPPTNSGNNHACGHLAHFKVIATEVGAKGDAIPGDKTWTFIATATLQNF